MTNLSTTIITVTYNSSSRIKKLLKSISDYTDKSNNIDIIIIDNNSKDLLELKDVIEQYKNKLEIKTVFRKKNLGFANSCNYGARLSKKHHLLFLNPDTRITKASLNNIVYHLKSANASIAGGLATINSTKNWHRTIFNKPTISDLLFEFSNLGKIFNKSGRFYIDQSGLRDDTYVSGVGGGYLLILSSIFKKLHGFDTKFFMYLEDVDLCIRAQNKGYKAIYCPHSVIYHEGGASSNNKYKILHKAWYDSREYYAYKHFSLSVSIPIFVMYRIERLVLKIREYFL